MTAHSGRGQGDPPLYEGVVLPANGDPWTPEQQREVAQTQHQPAAGQPWGQPWGPESQAAVAGGNGNGAAPPPLPPQAPPAPPEQPPAAPHQPPAQQDFPQPPAGQFPLPGHAGQTPPAAGGGHAAESAPSIPPAADMPLPPQQPLPPEGPEIPSARTPQDAQAFYGSAQPPRQPQQQPAPDGQQFGPGAPQFGTPPPQFGQDAGATQMLAPSAVPAPSAAASPSAPPSAHGPGQGSPAPSEAEATQYIPPVSGAPSAPGPYQPAPSGAAPDAESTQMLPPQTGQAPPQTGPVPAQDPEATAQLRTPLPPEAPAGGGPQQQAQPPAGFESLFRSEPGDRGGGPDGASGEPGSTQSLPIFDRAATRQRGVGGLGTAQGRPGAAGPAGPGAAGPYVQGPPPGGAQPQGRAARRNAERSALSRISPGVLIGVGVAVVAGVGMVAGAAMSGGEDEKSAKPKKEAPAARSDQRSGSGGGADPVEAQAKQLDKLLADSNNSRATVIRSVENIKACKKLRPAATDLRAAAGQRNSLVERLGKLETDKIPAQEQLRASLTRAWKASASADNHYAAWAGQVAGKKGCRKGKARTTAHVGLGARASGEATAAKKQAARLWNPTAKKYGLKQRQVGQL